MATVTLTLEIPKDWIDGFIMTTDLFRTNAAGYWAYGLAYDRSGAWLVWEHDDRRMPSEHMDQIADAFEGKGAILGRFSKACEVASSLGYDRSKFYLIDRAVAGKIYAECVRAYGVNDADCADASQLDYAVQRALGIFAYPNKINPRTGKRDESVRYG